MSGNDDHIYICCLATDYSKGFGGKYGVQKDHVDKTAVGWDHHEKLEQHESQKGTLQSLYYATDHDAELIIAGPAFGPLMVIFYNLYIIIPL